jgi:hypothetical protein
MPVPTGDARCSEQQPGAQRRSERDTDRDRGSVPDVLTLVLVRVEPDLIGHLVHPFRRVGEKGTQVRFWVKGPLALPLTWSVDR